MASPFDARLGASEPRPTRRPRVKVTGNLAAQRACDQCHRSKTRCERSSGDGTNCRKCEVAHKECTTERPLYRCGAKPGAHKRKSTSRASTFSHERNYDANDFVSRPEVALTPLPVTLRVPMATPEVEFDSNEMKNNSSVGSSMIIDDDRSNIVAMWRHVGDSGAGVDYAMSEPSTSYSVGHTHTAYYDVSPHFTSLGSMHFDPWVGYPGAC